MFSVPIVVETSFGRDAVDCRAVVFNEFPTYSVPQRAFILVDGGPAGVGPATRGQVEESLAEGRNEKVATGVRRPLRPGTGEEIQVEGRNENPRTASLAELATITAEVNESDKEQNEVDAVTFTITDAPLGTVELCYHSDMKNCVSVDGEKVVGLTAVRADNGQLLISFEERAAWIEPVFVVTTPPFRHSPGRRGRIDSAVLHDTDELAGTAGQ